MDFSVAMHLAPTQKSVNGYANDAVKNFKRLTKLELDYSLKSLRHLDKVLQTWRGQGAKISDINKTLFSFGSYAGQVVLRHTDGSWQENEDDPFADLQGKLIFVRLRSGERWNPIEHGFQIMMGNPEGYYESAVELLEGIGINTEIARPRPAPKISWLKRLFS